jgi:SAM-dependent methyltransferase
MAIVMSTNYFDCAYRDYWAQNPRRKLDHYLSTIEGLKGAGPTTLLDLGCGRGAFLSHAASVRPNWKLFGTDIEPEGLATTSSLVPSARVAMASADEQIFGEDSFDVISAWDVLEHIADLTLAANAIQSMLKSAGIFTFVVPVYDGPTGSLVRRLDKDPTHVHKSSRRWWLEWAAGSFDVVYWHGLVRYLLTPKHYVHLPTKSLRAIAPAILVACRQRGMA